MISAEHPCTRNDFNFQYYYKTRNSPASRDSGWNSHQRAAAVPRSSGACLARLEEECQSRWQSHGSSHGNAQRTKAERICLDGPGFCKWPSVLFHFTHQQFVDDFVGRHEQGAMPENIYTCLLLTSCKPDGLGIISSRSEDIAQPNPARHGFNSTHSNGLEGT